MTHAVAAIWTAIGVFVPAFVGGGVDSCASYSPYGYCLEWTNGSPGGSRGGDGGTSEPSNCYWRVLPGGLSLDPTVYYEYGFAPPPAGVEIAWQELYCSDGSAGLQFRWVLAVTPENLAATARGRLVGGLPAPAVHTSPPSGTPSIVGVPVFVEITNWTGVVTETECAAGLCVTLTARPSLTFASGEPGSPLVRCAGRGTRYDPSGPPADRQASEPGSCAHAYELRTGSAGRPPAWPGAVSVTWVLSWTASSGPTGSLPSVTRLTPVPRSVDEVQSVVVGGEVP